MTKFFAASDLATFNSADTQHVANVFTAPFEGNIH